ncbi:MAG: cytochrome C biosynthesis protein [Candidatus Anammoximicrobium sp.]|nr:cytochrome C biosynthesis protein [Candidatus Anammoximicrobium sp.]
MTRKSRRILLAAIAIAVVIGGAWSLGRLGRPSVDDALAVPRLPQIRPDYSGITIPPNIAPLNFSILEEGTRFFVRTAAEAGAPFEIVSRSPKITIPADRWRAMLAANRGKDLRWEIYAEQDGQWRRYRTVVNRIAEQDIDSHLVYRLIPPVHNKWREVAVWQRDLTSYRESVVLEGTSFGTGCVNCHSFASNDPGRMLIGVRSEEFGHSAILVNEGQVQKIGARFGYTAWHPSGRLAVYSINRVWQFFHAAAAEVRDVMDVDAGLAYYLLDAQNVKIVPRAADKTRLENYPAWSPDGQYLYYCSAPILWNSGDPVPPARYAEVKYDLMRIRYDLAADHWGDPEPVLSSEQTGLSILQPRISPDGRFLLFCMCRYGGFPVYQPSSDLYLLDLRTGAYTKLEVNSEFSESWHSWSSNGRWIAFSSKRRGGLFTRCYLSFVDDAGKSHKPWLVPQRDPEHYEALLKTISVPELITGPVPVTGEILTQAVVSDRAVEVDAVSGASGGAGRGEPWQPTRE